MSFESVAFEKSLQKTNRILRMTGLQTNDNESNQSNQTFMERLWSRKFYCFLNSVLYCELIGEVAWMVNSIMEGKFLEATNCAPCVTLCFLGTAKTYYIIKYGHHINDLIISLRKLQSPQFDSSVKKSPTAFGEIRCMVRKLHLSIKTLTIVNVAGLGTFLLSPLAIMAYEYYTSGKVELRLPFLVMYPFNEFDLRIYPFIYARHVITGLFGIFTVVGPDCLYYTFCTFVQVQFRLLYHDFESIVTPNVRIWIRNGNDKYHEKFRACISRHRELIRCTNLIETVYSKSSLFNFMSSSLLLCLAGFNIMAYEDLAVSGNFIGFLFLCLLQIYLICVYGGNVSRASMDLSSAVYNSQWYTVDVKTAKNLLVILTRAQKSCKLTAYMYAEINLEAFTRILSTSWSYFALLKSVYSKGGEH